ncbi:MAG TPA: NUDIX domain-containing protein [Candidatus Saccharimonadales bacterium]|nr:NUDIX domain-containing protein [Candidatus Saccharimonadales bacterium]
MTFAKLPPEDIRKHKGVSFTGITTVFWCYDGRKIFLAKRSKQARDEHGRWDPGAGGLKHGQTLEDNVCREVQEEYGTKPLCLDFIGYRDVFRQLEDGTPTHWLAMDFAAKVDPLQLHIQEPDMFDDSGWFRLDRLPDPLHSQFDTFLRLHGDTLRSIMARV